MSFVEMGHIRSYHLVDRSPRYVVQASSTIGTRVYNFSAIKLPST